MTHNPNNEKYKSALDGLSFEARQVGKAAIEFRRSRGRRMESHKFFLRPVLRSPPDVKRLGCAILELAVRSGDQKTAKKEG